MRFLTTVLLTPTLLALPLALPAAAGPPTICHPVEIGDADSLPFGDGPFETGDLALADLVPETVRCLEASNDALVHMETLRRALIYLMHSDDPVAGRLLQKLTLTLREGALWAAVTDHRATAEEQALAWFDLGYWSALRGEYGATTDPITFEALEKAGRLAPDDVGIHFGVANASILGREHRDRFHRHLALAARAPAGSRVADAALALVRRAHSSVSGESREAMLADLARLERERAAARDEEPATDG